VPLFRRRESLHDRLAREGGLGGGPPPEPAEPWGAEGDPASAAAGSADPAGDASGHRWMETGVHGVPRQREWDAVVAVEAEGVEGDRVRFVALGDDTLVVEEGEDVEPIAAALDDVVDPPYRAEAVRRGETSWAVGLRRIEVVELTDDPGGDELTLTVRDGGRTLLVDGASTFGSIPALERLGAARGESYVVEGRRLTDNVWEVRVTPL
jgi:hypothetical protein